MNSLEGIQELIRTRGLAHHQSSLPLAKSKIETHRTHQILRRPPALPLLEDPHTIMIAPLSIMRIIERSRDIRVREDLDIALLPGRDHRHFTCPLLQASRNTACFDPGDDGMRVPTLARIQPRQIPLRVLRVAALEVTRSRTQSTQTGTSCGGARRGEGAVAGGPA
jgi:hypothetical protein